MWGRTQHSLVLIGRVELLLEGRAVPSFGHYYFLCLPVASIKTCQQPRRKSLAEDSCSVRKSAICAEEGEKKRKGITQTELSCANFSRKC